MTRRPRHHRARRVLVAGLAAIALAACGSSEADVEATRAALGPVEEQVVALPGVVSASVDVSEVTGVAMADTIEVRVTSDATDAEGLVEAGRAAAELVWDAPVPDVAVIDLRVFPEDDGLTDEDGGDLEVAERMSREDLEAAFGPRPAGD